MGCLRINRNTSYASINFHGYNNTQNILIGVVTPFPPILSDVCVIVGDRNKISCEMVNMGKINVDDIDRLISCSVCGCVVDVKYAHMETSESTHNDVYVKYPCCEHWTSI